MSWGLRCWALGWIALIALAGCSSPSDVEASYASKQGMAQKALTEAQQGMTEVQNDYVSDMATAREWNVHVLGIPASGWVFIIVVAIVLAFVSLIPLSLWVRETLTQRRNNAARLALEQEKTKQAEAEARKAEWDSVQRYVPPALSKSPESS